MAQPVTVNGVQIYPLATGKAIPNWLSAAKRKQLNKEDPNFARRIQLLQDFSFPEASHTVQVTQDGRYIVATGTYHPRVRVWDTTELSMKFERYMDSATVACASIGEDYSKLAFLQEDRNIEVHARYGRHYKTRVPVAGRHMAWHSPTAELLVASSGSDVYRLSMEEGRFLAPMQVQARAANHVAVSKITALIGIACEGGTVEVWDPRGPNRAALLRLPSSSTGAAFDATCLSFEEAGLGLAVGTSDARAMVYDLRRATPLSSKSHPYGLPVKTVAFHRGGGVRGDGAAGADQGASLTGAKLVLSSDAKQIKLWHRDDGRTFTNIEGNAPLNEVAVVSDSPWVGGGDSGLLLAASEQERVQAYYVPALGLAPKWASFLDSLTEELAEGRAEGEGAAAVSGVYDDFRFITREELGSMGLEHLIGTPLLKAYMHGFFMDARLFGRVKAVLDGSSSSAGAYEAIRKERVAAELAKARASRVQAQDALPAVNADLVKRLRGTGADAGPSASASAPAKASSSALLADDRFARLFSDPAFAIDAEEAEVINTRRGTPAATGAAGAKGKRGARGEEEDGQGRSKRGRGAGRRRDDDSDEDA